MAPYARRVVAINGSGGAAVVISSTIAARRVEISECPPDTGTFNGANYLPQGLNYQLYGKANDGTQTLVGQDTFGLNPGDMIYLGNKIAEGRGKGPLVGGPAQNCPSGIAIPATKLSSIKSATVTATQVLVTEYP